MQNEHHRYQIAKQIIIPSYVN